MLNTALQFDCKCVRVGRVLYGARMHVHATTSMTRISETEKNYLGDSTRNDLSYLKATVVRVSIVCLMTNSVSSAPVRS